MPTAKAPGTENNMSNPPRATRGLPHPGRSTISATNVAKAKPIKPADILPRRIVMTLLAKHEKQDGDYPEYIEFEPLLSIEMRFSQLLHKCRDWTGNPFY
jgi:hypothetical protein